MSVGEAGHTSLAEGEGDEGLTGALVDLGGIGREGGGEAGSY